MLRRTLIVVALVALLATSAWAAGPEDHTGKQDGKYESIKVNMEERVIGWPYEYKALPLCVIPVYMNVGYFVQVEKCWEEKIELSQFDCADPRVGKGANDFPCYWGCTKIKVRANFEAKLGMKKAKVDGSPINGDKWSAWIEGSDIVAAGGAWNEIEVCVKAWMVTLYKTAPGTKVHVGNVTVTVKPNV